MVDRQRSTFAREHVEVPSLSTVEAALESPLPGPGKRAWTREEISLTVDRLFVEVTGIRDFTDRSTPVD